MEDSSSPKKYLMEDRPSPVCFEDFTDDPVSSVCFMIPDESIYGIHGRIHTVPQQLRVHKDKQRVYDPAMVSLGPYHHGKPRFRIAEKFKDKILQILISENKKIEDKDEGFFMDHILKQIDDIRNCYVGISIKICDDPTLAKMILRDALFVIYAMNIAHEDKLTHYLGVSGVAFMAGDFCMLENQIPLKVIRLLINLIYDQSEGEELIRCYLSHTCFGDDRLEKVPWLKFQEAQPLHLLDAQRRILCGTQCKQPPCRIFSVRWLRWKYSDADGSSYKRLSLPFRSVTDLKSKGVHFRHSSSTLNDVSFESCSFYGRLKLPIWFVTNTFKVLLRNMVAYEMSPEAGTRFEATSYVNFMKALIESPNDVKQLRCNEILFSNLGSDEEVVEVFQEIDTHGLDNDYIFHDVKMHIEKYYASKINRWMGELFFANFRTPWAVTAFLAAILLLCLTFLQTYFTINPTSKGK